MKVHLNLWSSFWGPPHCFRLDNNDVFSSVSGDDCKIAQFPLLNMSLHRGLIRGVEFEISGPIRGPGRQNLDAFASALHKHILQR